MDHGLGIAEILTLYLQVYHIVTLSYKKTLQVSIGKTTTHMGRFWNDLLDILRELFEIYEFTSLVEIFRIYPWMAGKYIIGMYFAIFFYFSYALRDCSPFWAQGAISISRTDVTNSIDQTWSQEL